MRLGEALEDVLVTRRGAILVGARRCVGPGE